MPRLIRVIPFAMMFSHLLLRADAKRQGSDNGGISAMASKYNYNCHSSGSFTPFNAPENPEKLKEAAKKELGETEELKEECLKKLRKLIKDNNLKCHTADSFLIRFLRVKGFHVQKSFQTLQNYAKHKEAIQKHIQTLHPDTVKALLRHNIISILPYLDAEGRIICLFKLGAWNCDICSVEDLMTTLYLTSYYTAERQSAQVNGVVFAHTESLPFDLVNYLMGILKFISDFYFDGVPQRYPALHLVNETNMVNYFLQVISPFLPKEIKEKFFFHGNCRETLFQHLPPDILPEELGGNLGPLNNHHIIEGILKYLKEMKDE